MFARLDHEVIDGHSTYALTIRQADVHVRDLTEKASMGMRNYNTGNRPSLNCWCRAGAHLMPVC
jgi:hypothetical protein